MSKLESSFVAVTFFYLFYVSQVRSFLEATVCVWLILGLSTLNLLESSEAVELNKKRIKAKEKINYFLSP